MLRGRPSAAESSDENSRGKVQNVVTHSRAILDRFLHHAELIQITGKSYRLRNRASATPNVSDKKQPSKSKTDQSAHRVKSGRSTRKNSLEKEKTTANKAK